MNLEGLIYNFYNVSHVVTTQFAVVVADFSRCNANLTFITHKYIFVGNKSLKLLKHWMIVTFQTVISLTSSTDSHLTFVKKAWSLWKVLKPQRFWHKHYQHFLRGPVGEWNFSLLYRHHLCRGEDVLQLRVAPWWLFSVTETRLHCCNALDPKEIAFATLPKCQYNMWFNSFPIAHREVSM